MFEVISLFVLVESFVEFSKRIGTSLSRCDAFSFVVLYFCDEYSLLYCFDLRDIPDTFELFKDSFNVLLSLYVFFPDAFLKLLLRSFNRCFSPLGMLLHSSMSLRISASLSRNSSLSFAAADVVTCASLLLFLNSLAFLLEWNTIEPNS